MKNVADIYALSPMQKLMLLHVKATDSAHDILFNQIVYDLSGSLNHDAYQQAWQLMVDRHAVLRTMFVWQDGKDPLQVVREKLTLPWQEHDWRRLPAVDQQSELQGLLAADRAAGFDMLQPPLMRLHLIQLAEAKYWLVWSSHHLIIDRWCIGIIFEELQAAYEAYAAGGSPVLPPAPRYRSYIAWLGQQDEAAAQAFWRKNLGDVSARPLPLQPVSGAELPQLAQKRLTLEGASLAALRASAVDNNLTLSSLVTGAWMLLLAGLTGTNDVLCGLTVSGRPAELPDMAGAVGCFINNVPLRATLDDQVPTADWLRNLQNKQLELRAFEYASQAQIQEWSDHRRRGPLFDSLIVYQAPVQTAVPEGLDIQFAQGGMQTGYPLTLGVVPQQDRLRLTLTYDKLRVPNQLIDQVVAHLQRILLALPPAANAPLSSLRAAFTPAGSIEPAMEPTTGVDVQASYVPPRTAIEQVLSQIWAEVLGLPRVSIEDRFFDLGGDSVHALLLITLVEQRLGQNLAITQLFSNPTAAEMAGFLSNDQTGAPVEPVLLPINQAGEKTPFFYAHGIFGDVSSLTNIVPLLPADQPLFGLQAMGLHPDHEPDQTFKAMAAHCVEAVQRVQPSGPYLLGGFCYGGVLAYEIARQLEENGEKIALLAIIEGSAPRQFHRPTSLFAAQRLNIIRHSAPQLLRGNKEFGGWQLRKRWQRRFGKPPEGGSGNGQDQWDVEFDNLADFNASRPPIQQQIRAINAAAIEQYQPGPINSRVTLFRAKYLPMGHTMLRRIDPLRGWGSLAKGGVALRFVDGSHIGVLRQPHVASLAAELTTALYETSRTNKYLAP